MKNLDMLLVCHKCTYHQTIYYADGHRGCGCLAHNMESAYPVDINNIDRCPLGKNEKK